MTLLTSAKLNDRGGARLLHRLAGLLAGGILLQTAGGCQDHLSSFIDALGQPVATGIGNAVSNLLQALVVGVFI
jgi:hypothetical protein